MTGSDASAAQSGRDGADRATNEGSRRVAVAFAALVLAASLVPIPSGTPTGGETVLPAWFGLTGPFHLVGYAVLAALLVRATRRRRFGLLFAAVAAVAFGFGVELVQAPIPWRSFAWGDAAVNAAGAAVGTAVAALRREPPSRSGSVSSDRDADR